MRPYILLSALAILCLAACHKKSDEEQFGTTEIIQLTGINVYGSPFNGCKICYSAIGSGAKSYYWRSSDGVTSTDPVFCRTYAGEYMDTVTLTINNDPDFTVSQMMFIYEVPPGITSRLAGSKTWRVFEGESLPDGTNTLAYTGNANFEIMYIDPGTLRIANDTLRLQPGFGVFTGNRQYDKSVTDPLSGLGTFWMLQVFDTPTGDSLTYSVYTNLSPSHTAMKVSYCP